MTLYDGFCFLRSYFDGRATWSLEPEMEGLFVEASWINHLGGFFAAAALALRKDVGTRHYCRQNPINPRSEDHEAKNHYPADRCSWNA